MRLGRRLSRRATRFIAGTVVRNCDAADCRKAFAHCWKSLTSSPLYLWLMRFAHPSSPFRRIPLYSHIYEQIASFIPGYYADATLHVDPELLDAINGSYPLLIVQVHERHRFLSKALGTSGRKVVRLSSDPARHLQKLEYLGIATSRITVFEDNILSLLKIRRSLGNETVICCAIDYSDTKGGGSILILPFCILP